MIRTDRVLPQDLNAEAAVLSAMMVDDEAIPEVLDFLVEDHFYRNSHRLIFNAIKLMFMQGIEIDIITLIDNLKKSKDKRTHKNHLEMVGGESFINDLSDVVLSGANIVQHAKIVKNKAMARQLIVSANSILEKAYGSEMDGVEVLEFAEETILKVSAAQVDDTMSGPMEGTIQLMKNAEDAYNGKQRVRGVPSGFVDLDRITGGFGKGQLIILAARPAMGKSSLALAFASNAVKHYNKKVGLLTMEMESLELLAKIVSMESEVPLSCFNKGHGWDERKIMRASSAAQAISELNLQIDDAGSNTSLTVRAKARRMKAKMGGLDMILIDYLQLMSGTGKEGRQQEISEISRNLKILAKELSIPIIALSQLNRGVEGREDKRPKLSDLRESGAIEQDADVVMFLYRDVVYNPETDFPEVAELILGKNRHGPIGTVYLSWFPEFTLFRNAMEASYYGEKKGDD